MKVKVISRNPDEYLRETKFDIHKGITNTVCKTIFNSFPFQLLEIMTQPCTPLRVLENTLEP